MWNRNFTSQRGHHAISTIQIHVATAWLFHVSATLQSHVVTTCFCVVAITWRPRGFSTLLCHVESTWLLQHKKMWSRRGKTKTSRLSNVATTCMC